MKIVIYKNKDEVIISTLEEEHKLLEEFFVPNMGRDKEDYDRIIKTEPFNIESSVSVRL